MKLKLSVVLAVVLVLGLVCSVTLAARHTKHSREQRKHRNVRAILPQLPIPIETPEQIQPEFNFTVPVIGVYPQLVPANQNTTLFISLFVDFPQNSSYCCIFGNNASSTPATVNGTLVQCEIPALNMSGCVTSYIAPCFNGSSPVSSNFTLIWYDELPNITEVHPPVLNAFGGQEVSINITSLPWNETAHCNSSFSYACKAGDYPYSWPANVTKINDNETVISCFSSSLPIGLTNISVIFSFNQFGSNTSRNVIASKGYAVNVTSVHLEDFSPKVGCVTGATNITLNVTSFARMINITNTTQGNNSLPFCHFAPKYQHIPGHISLDRKVTPVLVDENRQQFYCHTPSWNYTETSAVLTLVDEAFFTPLSNPVTFEYITSCLGDVFPYSAPVCAIGSVPVFISGTFLPDHNNTNSTRNSTEIATAFIYADAAKTELIANRTFHYVNNSAGYYLTSLDEFHHETTYVQVATEYHVISPEYKIETTNSCIASVDPQSVLMEGGAQVVLTLFNDMFGFHNASSNYYCYFVDPLGYTSAISAAPVAANQLGCTAPRVSSAGVGSVSMAIRLTNSTARATSSIPITFDK